MNRAKIDSYIGRIRVDEARLRAVLTVDPPPPPRVKDIADATLKRTDKFINHPGLEVLKQGVDNFEGLPPEQQSQITQLSTVWIANAKETLKTLHMLSDAVG